MSGTFLKLADSLYSFTYLYNFPEMTVITVAGSGSLLWMLTISLCICETVRC